MVAVFSTPPGPYRYATEKNVNQINEPLAVMWDKDDGTGVSGFFVCKVYEDTIKVDHLVTQKNTSSRHWIRENSDDVQLVSYLQVIPVYVIGEWNFRNERQPVFVLENVDNIVTSFEKTFDAPFPFHLLKWIRPTGDTTIKKLA